MSTAWSYYPRIDPLDFEQAVHRVAELARGNRAALVVTPNVDHIVTLSRDEGLRRAYALAELVIADGAPLVWLSRILRDPPLPTRVNGTNLFEALCVVAARDGLRVFLLGADEETSAAAAEVLAARHPTLVICGRLSPPSGFENDPEQRRDVVARITNATPHVIAVCLGSPKQEKWYLEEHESLPPGVYLGLGGVLDYVSGRVRRAPVCWQQNGFEWLYRLLHEPGRLWRRYLVRDPVFLLIAGRRIGSRLGQKTRPFR